MRITKNIALILFFLFAVFFSSACFWIIYENRRFAFVLINFKIIFIILSYLFVYL